MKNFLYHTSNVFYWISVALVLYGLACMMDFKNLKLRDFESLEAAMFWFLGAFCAFIISGALSGIRSDIQDTEE